MSHSPNQPGPRLSPEEHENLSAYLDHELDEAQTEKISADLSRRPEVRQEANSLRKTWELLDYLPRPKAPHSFTEQTLTRLQSTKGILLQQGIKWRRYAIAGWAACVMVAAAFGFWLTYSVTKPAEIVEVAAPVTDVVPSIEASHSDSAPSPHPTATNTAQSTLPKKDFRLIQRTQKEISQQRNERLSREIMKVLAELRKKATEKEKDQLLELSKKGGLAYLAAVLKLAEKYNIPLVDHTNDAVSTAPAKAPKKGQGKNKEAFE
jgi:hypothetical protein